jgi:hypothetical protein
MQKTQANKISFKKETKRSQSVQGFSEETSVGTMLRMMCERDNRVYMNYKHGKMKEYFQYIKHQPIPLNTENLNTDL